MAPVSCICSAPAAFNFPTKLIRPAFCAYSSIGRRHVHSPASAIHSERSHYDVIVVGGGLVGTAMACALGCSKIISEKRILLLEGSPNKPFSPKPRYSNRVSAINSASVGLFKDVGVWDNIKAQRVQPVKKMQVWDASSISCITFNHDDMSEPVAHIVENDVMLWALTERLKDFPNVSVMYNSKIQNYILPDRNSQQLPNVILDSGKILECDLLIGADGVNSKVRSELKMRYWNQSYNQMGVVATLRLAEKTDNVVAWQKFLPTGPIALLPLSDELSSLVWSTTPTHARTLLSLSSEEFVKAVNDAFMREYPLSPFVTSASKNFNSLLKMMNMMSSDISQYPPQVKYLDEGSRAAFPLGVGNASQYVKNCVALVGDAAHRVHPLAGQGVNLGFGDVHCLAHVLEAGVYNGAHIGRGKHLELYESERLAIDVSKVLGIHTLYNLYNTSFTPIVLLRSLGLSLIQALPSFKKNIIKGANI